MPRSKTVITALVVLLLAVGGCSRQQSDWQKARQTNTAEGYEQFLKRYPNGDFTVQAQARLKDLYTERDWEKARDADTPEAYQAFVTQHPEGKYADEARNRIENFNIAQTPGAGEAAPTGPASSEAPGAASAPSANAPGTNAPSANAPSAQVPTHPAPSTGSGGAQPTPPKHAHAPAQPAESHTEARSASAPGKRYGVQLGAFRSGGSAAAHRRWEALKKQYPQLLKGLTPKVVATKTTTGTVYRLQALGVSESSARHICKSLKAQSQACVVLRPSRS
ncbi:MAG TPA: SPOR domain-containing protein [Steroidobacteraceae bacterium]|nr:SPOR domain-containing protein [Steroidobacteraceae bacterium]